MSTLTGRTALVTGGTRGIGEAVARRLASLGARTIIASRKQDGVDAALARLADAGEVYGHAMHIGDPASIEAGMDAIEAAHGPVDLMVHNAATNPYFGPIVDIEPLAVRKTFEVNIFGTIHLTQRVARRLVADDRKGDIIVVSSVMGMQAAPLQGVYGMTKAALISMVQTLAVELGGAGIRVNGVAPGLVDTKFAATLTSSPELRKMFEDRTALGRIAQPEEIAGIVAWLASPEASYVTGQTIAVDGGYTIR